MPRAFEYPWVLCQLPERRGRRILDVGAGVSPLPLQLAATGADVLTVDNSLEVRRPGCDESAWNEWGYLDYAMLDSRVESHNCDILGLDLPTASLDAVYSVSVVEHMPAATRRRLWERIAQWLKPGGRLVLSVDLVPGGLTLWNLAAGQVVEPQAEHGDLPAMESELQSAGFGLHCRELLREMPETRVDCALLCLRRGTAAESPNDPQMTRVSTFSDPKRVVFGCTADNNPKYLAQAVRLAQSLRWFGGQLADAPLVVCAVESIPSDCRHRLEQLGARVRVVPRVSSQHGHSNKLRLLEMPELRQFDTVVLLDCDTVLVQDPRPWLDGYHFQAKMADVATVPHQIFAGLFDHFGLRLPPQDRLSNPGGQPTIWYCNAGVLVFPRAMLDTLAVAWRQWNGRLLARLDLLQSQRFFCDQASLSLAFAARAVPFAELPLAMNFPLHLPITECPALSTACDPVIIHYHESIDSQGCLQAAPNPTAQARVERYNRRVLAG